MRKLIFSLFVTVFLLLNVAKATCSAQVQSPDTPAARQCASWLKAFNRGDREAYRDFLQKNYPSIVKQLDQEMSFREQTGGFELRKVEESMATKFVALVQERDSDQFARLTLEVEATEPHRISSMQLRAIPRPAEFPLPHMSEGELIAPLRKNLEQDASAGRFAGAVLVSRDRTLAPAWSLSPILGCYPDAIRAVPTPSFRIAGNPSYLRPVPLGGRDELPAEKLMSLREDLLYAFRMLRRSPGFILS